MVFEDGSYLPFCGPKYDTILRTYLQLAINHVWFTIIHDVMHYAISIGLKNPDPFR